MAKDTFLSSVNEEKLKEIFLDTDKNVEYFNSVCNETAKKYSTSLDNLMSDLYIECIKTDDAPTSTLERYYLELTNMLYFMGEKLEQLGIYADMAKSASKEIYSKSYINNQVKDSDKRNKTTVAENQATAELASQYETVVYNIYDRAYSIVKYKISAAQEMVNTLRKIISHRMNEEQLSMYNRQ